ncbi:MAG: hypothetical protein WBG10_19245 [Pseudolabrys sp.]
MFKIIAAAALSAYVVYDATTAPGFTLTDELPGSAVAAKGDRLPALPAIDDCSDAVWPYYPSACLTRATLRVGQTTPERPVRFVTTLRPPANVQSQAFAQLERQ